MTFQLKVILLLLSMLFLNGYSQEKTKSFLIDTSSITSLQSKYSTIEYIDSRENTNNYGIVRIGSLNKEAEVVSENPIENQIQQLLTLPSTSITENGCLVFQLRNLKFVEKAEGRKEFGYCFFRANTYSRINNQYFLIQRIDTFIVVESEDVTDKILEHGGRALTKFIQRSLVRDTFFSTLLEKTEVVKIDSIEKSKIKVYNVDEYTNGVYTSFTSFKNQTPNLSLYSITFRDGEITGLKAKNHKGKVRRVKSDKVYAIVNKGVPYISAEFGYYPIVKNNNDFFFIGDDKQHYIKEQYIKSSSIFENRDYIYSPLPLITMYEIKIDHVNGKFMRVKEMKE